MKKNLFERNPKITLACLLVLFGVMSWFVLEKVAESFGLGNVVIYQNHAIYGYRPLPNQVTARKADKTIKINNLGLRAQTDWKQKHSENKILFLGDSITYGGSYIDNQELFSHLAVKNLKNWESGNAAVNAWGVLNVHALVKLTEFLPAEIYVSVFPEGDFYRGLMRIGGQPFWTRQPKSGLEELYQYFIFKAHLKKLYSSPEPGEKQAAAKVAANHLKELDLFLKSKGKKHLIYISPSKQQALGSEAVDPIVHRALMDAQVQVIYLKDKLPQMPTFEVENLYHDDMHLSVKGHEVWAKMISEDLKQILL